MRLWLILLLSISMAGVGLAGCGDDDDTADDDDDDSDAGGDDDDDATSVLHECEDFVDESAEDGDRTIAFSGTSYTPSCLQIAAGQTVTWEGTFSSHPLTAGVAPSREGDPEGSANNPIPEATNTGESLDVTFPTAGDYPFYCSIHQGAGMYGVIHVE